ncbi:MAG: glycosyltransferase family 4 protein [Sphingomonas sp.]|nr:glycosyltransferase family 4 protein [Sphingomonas sp.]
MPDLSRKGRKNRKIERMAVLSNGAYSLSNFRGPLIRSLVDRGIRVFALAPDFDERTRERVREFGAEPVDIAMERTGMRPLRDLLDSIRLARQLRALELDAVLSYFIKPVIYGSLAARAVGVPRRFAMVAGVGYVFISDGGSLPVRRRLLRWLVMRLYKLGFASCEVVFFQNGDDVDFFTRARLTGPARVVQIAGTGVDLDQLPQSSPPLRPVTFLLMARLLREKGIREYAEAARIVSQQRSGAHFVLLGGFDPNPGSLSRAEIDAWVSGGLLHWYDHVEDVRPWLARSSVYVLPSYREGKPRSTQEALAVGRAVITTDVPGCRDTVVDGLNGFLVPARDSVALAQAMIRFIDEPSLIVRMGEESRTLAEERFDVSRINAEMLRAMDIPDRNTAA